ncbi:MFS transporter [Rhizobium nepotum]|uniref:MFS transporter n=1 Tax=Rhizobium nepotum TaxID=1035271 RepID=UPI003CF13235
MVPNFEDGWRYALVITALPVVFVLWWRQALRESPRWLVSRGRTDEADAIVNSIEAEIPKPAEFRSQAPNLSY